jgi:hypothetical protein
MISPMMNFPPYILVLTGAAATMTSSLKLVNRTLFAGKLVTQPLIGYIFNDGFSKSG